MTKVEKTIRVTKHNINILNLDNVLAMVCDRKVTMARQSRQRRRQRGRQHLRPSPYTAGSKELLSKDEGTRNRSWSIVSNILKVADKK